MNGVRDLVEWAEAAPLQADRSFEVKATKGMLQHGTTWWFVSLGDNVGHYVEGLESSSLESACRSALAAWAVLEGRRWRT